MNRDECIARAVKLARAHNHEAMRIERECYCTIATSATVRIAISAIKSQRHMRDQAMQTARMLRSMK